MGTEGNSPGLPAGRKGRGPRPLPPLAYQLLKKASLRLLGVVRDACACTADGKLPSMQAARVTSNSLLRAAGFGRPVAIALLNLALRDGLQQHRQHRQQAQQVCHAVLPELHGQGSMASTQQVQRRYGFLHLCLYCVAAELHGTA